jgi:iron-sulfur cluster insertion protein
MADTAVATAPQVTVTPNAAKRVLKLIDMEGKPGLMLRLAVLGGGCSGFQYQIVLDDATGDEDVVSEQHGIKLVIDQTSLDLLSGTEVDFVEDLMGASFQIRNPNATSTCGCGSSFSV